MYFPGTARHYSPRSEAEWESRCGGEAISSPSGIASGERAHRTARGASVALATTLFLCQHLNQILRHCFSITHAEQAQ